MKNPNYCAMLAVLAVSLLMPPGGSSQMPALAKLIVRSRPPGAAILVKGQKTGQYTDAQFVVEPGSYWVSVSSSAPGGANCNNSQSFDLKAGSSQILMCAGGKWE